MTTIRRLGGDSFLANFNYHGKITDLPASFRRPAFNSSLVSQPDNFLNAFNSPLYSLNKDAVDIINGAADPYFATNAFSANQPGTCDIHANRKVLSGSCMQSFASQIRLTAEITAPGQTVRVNKYFANAFSVDR